MINNIYKRFYLVELKDPLSEAFFEAKLFLSRNYVVFTPAKEYKGTFFGFIILDFGKEINIDRAWQYLDNLFKPISLAWLDRSELRAAIEYCYLFSDKYHLYTKGNFLQDYLPQEDL